jgi:SOS-response transcriptional repressor LexA
MNRQDQIVEFIKSHVTEKGYAPTIREITKAVGLQSSSTTHGHLERLKKKGVITWENGSVRTLKLVVKPEVMS